MLTTSENIRKNRSHYDELYGHVSTDRIVAKIRNLPAFLTDAIATDTTWHGLYHWNLREALRGRRVLELGSGDGLNAIVMAALGADVVANDISKESERIITSTASRLGLSNVRAITGDFADLPFEPRSFDYVIGKALLHHLTHELESGYLAKVAVLLKPDGEARFLEPATNSPLLDWLRWMVPVPGRPSSLHKRAFARWKANDPHPERDNSSEHYARVGRDYFRTVRILPIGSVERFCRLMPSGKLNRRYRRWAHRMEERLPMWLRHKAARSQVIQYRDPLA